jgi:hypothetical protein
VFLCLFILQNIVLNDAIALMPLLPILDIADKDLEFWYKDGQFLVGIKEKSKAIDPFTEIVPPNPQEIPKDISTWNSIGKACDKKLKKHFKIDQVQYEVILKEIPMKEGLEFGSLVEGTGFFEIQLYRDGLFMAQNSIPRPIDPCTITLLDVDQFVGEEILISWSYATNIKGMIIYSIPDSVK